ncbi:TetR/AcrR family transcriptional regulator [Actinomycetospora cinnamomea]|uniref:TetR/AcrR family transcriptional regulator n=1 Tax=Actinomycetospora cinnamomea TaxID=663609 RepID=UPI000E322845|nr:TetR/AcrR family transcriptional regulator [Actinomycetospora cinnamomea]
MAPARPYHHGDLRRAVLDAAIDVIAEAGPAAISLRDLARRAGVSHAAPAHHFGDKAGLLTAIAAEGQELLADRLHEAHRRSGGDFLEVGVAYVRFAVEHRAHFEIMYRPELHRPDDPAVIAGRTRAGAVLYRGASERGPGRSADEVRTAGLAAWSLVHGFATLWIHGALPEGLGDDPEAAARTVARHLGVSPG